MTPEEASEGIACVERMRQEYHRVCNELEQERARLDWLEQSRVNYIRRDPDVSLFETDCGAMILHGTGKTLKEAIDKARGTE